MNEVGDFIVYVKTGDRKFAGTDANVRIRLHDESGNVTEEAKLDNFLRNDFERGQTDSFVLKRLEKLKKIHKIEMWRDNAGFGANWYVDTVEVEDRISRIRYTFPIYRWIKADYHYHIHHLDTSLPQLDPQGYQRRMEVDEKKNVYEFIQRGPGLPSQVKQMPPDEQFSFDYKWNIVKTKAELIATSKLVMITGGQWENLASLKNVYTEKIFCLPEGAQQHRFGNDVVFGLQRIASMNHSLIELCEKIPENFDVSDDILRPYLEGWTLQQVIDAKRLFIVNLAILEDIPCRKDFVGCAPMALFLVNDKQQLAPIAIQLFQKKGPDNPVFLPSDPRYTWLLAKMWFNNADAAYHQSLTHLGFTHLLMEGVTVATHRNLSQSHPLFKLLAHHFLYLIAINTRGLEVLISPNGWVDKTMNIGLAGMFALIKKGIDMWRLDVHGTLPEDLKRRGVYSSNVLPGYHFRDDALLHYHAIHNYVAKYVALYYDVPEKIKSDWEVQGWGEELVKEREKGGCGLKGVPKNGKFETREDLVLVLTSIIFTCTVSHASTNFPQYDEYAYPPNYPSLMRGVPPKDKSEKTEEDVLKSLPDKPTTLDIMIVTKILSGKGTNSLGNFEVQYIFDPEAKKIVEEFREEISEVSKEIKMRNQKRLPPYLYLDPDIVPNSISI
ncbi:hypothetical protein ScPMuIL_009834 [Solemya velum]